MMLAEHVIHLGYQMKQNNRLYVHVYYLFFYL